MKVSALIKEIVKLSEEKFGISNHLNDCVSVGVFVNTDDTWFAWLERPTQEQLDRGEVQKIASIKRFDTLVAFTSTAETLVDALLALQGKVKFATKWPK